MKQSPNSSSVLQVIEEMHEGMQIIDPCFRYLYVNKAAAAHGQKEPEDLIGKTMSDCYPGIESTEMFSNLERTLKDGITRRMDNEFQFPNGDKGWFNLLFEAHESGVLIRSLNITDRKILEEKFAHADKMNALGKLAGGVAHEFNNILGTMQLFCELAIKTIPENQDEALEYLKQIDSAVSESSQLTRQLLALSRKQVLTLETMEINSFLEAKVKFLNKLVGESIEINTQFFPQLWNIKMDPTQFDQIILNLIINARDAMPDGGQLTIETSNQHLDADYCQFHPEATTGDYVLISVSDNGVGMTDENRKHIFEPFFTTKPAGQGTGLGLATVHGIVRQAKGHIWVYSEEGMGTTFKIYFPRAFDVQQKQVAKVPNLAAENLQGEETVLLVEDNELLREAISTTLESYGYKVLTAGTAKEAVTTFEENKNEIDLLITDVILKASKGDSLAKNLLQRKPEMRLLFISGYTEAALSQNGALKTDHILLQKPFSIIKLLQVVRQIFDNNLTTGVF